MRSGTGGVSSSLTSTGGASLMVLLSLSGPRFPLLISQPVGLGDPYSPGPRAPLEPYVGRFPGALSWWLRRESVCLQCGEPGFDPWVGNIPRRRKWQPTPVFLPRKFHRQRSLAGYSPWGRKESDMTEQLLFLLSSSLSPTLPVREQNRSYSLWGSEELTLGV